MLTKDEPLTYDPMVADLLIQRYKVKGARREDVAGAVHVLIKRGRSVSEIAHRLGISDRTVQRYREMALVPETEVVQTYSELACNCESHEYNSTRTLYQRNRKECTA